MFYVDSVQSDDIERVLVLKEHRMLQSLKNELEPEVRSSPLASKCIGAFKVFGQ